MDELQHNEPELAKEFLDAEYRRAWAEDYVDTTLALQIAALRRARDWSQADLAHRAGTGQSAVSRMEDVTYGAHSIRVLKQLAAAFGLRLKVSFEEFGSLIRESTGFSEAALNRVSFHDDYYIAELLAAQGLKIDPPADVARLPLSPAAAPPDFDGYISFKEEFDRVLQCDVGDRIVSLRRWLKGYGLPSDDELPYKALYYSIPADPTHGDLMNRLGQSCAALLLPEGFGELLSDREDGARAVVNLFRLSIMLRAHCREIATSCEILFKWLEGDWSFLDERIQEAVVDLAADLDLVGEALLDWKEGTLNDRHRLMLCTGLMSSGSARAAQILEDMICKSGSEPLSDQTADKVIEISASPLFRSRELAKSSPEKKDIAITYLNESVRMHRDGAYSRGRR